MSRIITLVLAVLATTLLGVAPANSAADMDCGDFATQAEAQAFFIAAGAGDPHRLDSDGDGLACETNPCPCSTDITPIGGQPSPTPTPTPTPTATPTPTPTTPPEVIDPDGSGNSGPTQRDRARVVSVTDGDTLKVRLRNGDVEYVRLIGIDTPEVHGRTECGGAAASLAMERLAPVGSRVVLVSDPTQADRDRYDRMLRYVVRNGRDVGKSQISSGNAQVYVYRNDPFQRTDVYRRAESRSQARGNGSWARCWR